MAKKDNFDFETEGQHKLSLDLGSFKNLTKQQKGIILAAVVVIVLAIAFIVTFLIIGANGGNGSNSDNPGGSQNGSQSGETGGENNGEENNGENNNVLDDTITSIGIAVKPTKTSYYVGDRPNFSGLEIVVARAELDQEQVSYNLSTDEFTITGFDSSAPNPEQVITVEYKGFTATFTVKILEIPLATPTLVSIRLDPAPRDTAKAGVALSVKNSYIVCEYSDGSEKSIPLRHEHLYGYETLLENASIGDVITVYVRYSEDGYIAETSYTVTIIE